MRSTHSLGTRLALILTVVVSTYAALDHLVQRLIVFPRFEALEKLAAEQAVERVHNMIQGELDRVDRTAREWSRWSQTRGFVLDHAAPDDPRASARRERFAGIELERGRLVDAEIGLFAVVARDGRVLVRAAHDLTEGRPIDWRALSLDRLSPTNPLLVQDRSVAEGSPAAPDRILGLSMGESGPVLLASHPIPSADGATDWIGTVIVGRALDEKLRERIALGAAVDFELVDLVGPEADPMLAELVDEVTSSTELVVAQRDEHTLEAFDIVSDGRRIPTLLLRARVPREISSEGGTALRYALISTIAAGTLLVLVLLTTLRRIVLEPLARLTRHAVEVGRTDDYSTKLALPRRDEIGILSGEFDRMLEKLERSRAETVRTARVAGMSEISTGVLHNVGNALNSANISLGVITERVREDKLPKLERVVEMIEAQGDRLGQFILENPKGKHVAPFLCELTRLMRADHEDLAREAHKLGEGLEHLCSLVASQQEFAGKGDLREPARVEDLFALALTLTDLNRNEAGPRVDLACDELGRVLIDRHRLVQILVNLLKNASEAIAQADSRPGRIEVRAERTAAERLRITVSDDGIGIEPGDLSRIFNHGFTTKPGGHGFGLHSSANAAVEMGGKIEAASEGRGRGARFVIDLPIEKAPSA